MTTRLAALIAVVLLFTAVGPAEAVMAAPPTCNPDGVCITCVEYESLGGGQQRCVKCHRNPRCMRARPRPECRYNKRLPQCQQQPQYFGEDGLPQTRLRRPWRR